MSDSATSTQVDLQTLSEALVAATDRAADVQGAQNLAADYAALQARVTNAASALKPPLAVLLSPRLTPLATDVAAFNDSRHTLRALLTQVKASVASNPVGLRRGNLWRQADAAMTNVVLGVGVAIDRAFARLIAELPSPQPERLAAVPPAAAGIETYRRAIERYEQLREHPPRGPEDLKQFIAVAEKLGELQKQLLVQAVPAEHRREWQLLQQGKLPVTEFSDDFRTWLQDRGMLDNVYLRFLRLE